MPEEDDDKPREMKVTDRRMFTPDGELREEFRDLTATSEGRVAEPTPRAADEPRGPQPPAPPSPVAPSPAAPEGADRSAPADAAGPEPGAGPTFLDLVAVLAEPVPLYLGDTPLPDGRSVENLDAARFHIDLLDVLREKTAGTLSPQESGVLEDILYRLRMRFVQKRG
ncbi:MAG TPA: DUF1844 domain-containing protein [Thermoanaerobaculia bacterium]|nr:DUF1844 domain-containing protein [Thermoanaerobaculia bacterium]